MSHESPWLVEGASIYHLILTSTHTLVQENAVQFPTLAQMAHDYLAIPATSVSVERVFSKSWHICTDLRSSLKANMVTQALLTRVWIYSGLFTINPEAHSLHKQHVITVSNKQIQIYYFSRKTIYYTILYSILYSIYCIPYTIHPESYMYNIWLEPQREDTKDCIGGILIPCGCS